MRILFVCHGNICRSPMAEFIFKDMVSKKGESELFEIASAATSSEEIGNPVYPPAKRELAKHGISAEGKRARRLTESDFSYYDEIICMDDNNLKNIGILFGEGKKRAVRKLLTFANKSDDVADPWYTGDFEKTYEDILCGLEELYKYCKTKIESHAVSPDISDKNNADFT